jgi:hypothetical protein
MEKQPLLRKSKGDRVKISIYGDSGDFNATSAPAFEFSTDEEDSPAAAAGFDNLPKQICTSNRPTNSSMRSTTRKRQKGITRVLQKMDMAAAQFALRMAIMLMISSLFVLVDWPHGGRYPDGMWVLVSVLFVGWFPSLDAASVIEKITQRLIGTFIGAFLGLSCGFFSIWAFPTRTYQAIFLGSCMLFFNFGIIFVAGQFKIGPKKIIRRYAYATILCVLTFCICMLPFASEEDPKWARGVWRVCNVIVGCFLGAGGAVIVCPKSTTDVLHDKTARQVTLAGEASEAVLHFAADLFAGKVKVSRLADELIDTPLDVGFSDQVSSSVLREPSRSSGADVALKKYEDAITDWNASKALFPLAKFDPFHSNVLKDDYNSAIQGEIAKTLARALRIQTTIVVIDGMIRSDADYDFQEAEFLLFEETGTQIRRMLTLPFDIASNNKAALQLFDRLEFLRGKILRLSNAVSEPSPLARRIRYDEMKDFKASLLEEKGNIEADDDLGRGIPKFACNSNDNSLFFLQLVEHLILRSLRLYQVWKQVEMIPANGEVMGTSDDDLISVVSIIVG